ncbi:hypothetical protein O3W44_20535 [Pantoea sp. LMR881]|uniref:hypothetical protein n=1 Tax=Pantoea sp. LMR881 TaxID=3014336 RepID=UPI0022B07BE7|nr:hypothetical protein [Pantoea sp. LMR881]MCZ4060951.1 hypothetical protein [Pantoea sp. LMR881]
MPTLHNPLGWVMNDARRRELALIARTFDLLIIEDAAYAFFARRPHRRLPLMRSKERST